MPKGGKRDNSGRKKIGKVLNTRIDMSTIDRIEDTFSGKNRAEKIRNCLDLGLKKQEQIDNQTKSYHNVTVKNFATSYTNIFKIFEYAFPSKSYLENIKSINLLLQQCFYISNNISKDLLKIIATSHENYNKISSIAKLSTCLSENDIKKISRELSKFTWSLNEFDDVKNVITPKILGYFFEQFINQKEMGAYFTSEDISIYMCEYAIICSIISLCPRSDEITQFMLDILKVSIDTYTKNHSYIDPISFLSIKDIIANNVDIIRLFIDSVINENFSYKEEVLYSLYNTKILDPTVGTGAFIIISANILIDLFDKINNDITVKSRKEYIKHLFCNCLYGVDIMEDSIEILQLRIHLYLRINGLNETEISEIKTNFKCGNTLFDTSKFTPDSLKEMYNTLGANYSDYNEWLDICKPFVWSLEFSNAINQGGFTCIIGNPPYVEKSKAKNLFYSLSDYKTKTCGNLYAFIYEKSLDLLAKNGTLSLIVPISIISTTRMKPLLDLIKTNCNFAYFASFGDRPATLFTGVHQKVAITLCQKGNDLPVCDIFTSPYYHWLSNERNSLFNHINYYKSSVNMNRDCYYKIGSLIQDTIVTKVTSKGQKLSSYFSKNRTDFPIYLNMRATFWCKCFTSAQLSKEYKVYYLNSEVEQQILYSLFNSSLFFLLWETTSDCWHITSSIFDMILIDIELFYKTTQKTICSLAKDLEFDLESNKNYIGSVQVEYEYLHKKSKSIIDEIDYTLAKYYKFNNNEFSYILNYNLKYRMSDELVNYIKGDDL